MGKVWRNLCEIFAEQKLNNFNKNFNVLYYMVFYVPDNVLYKTFKVWQWISCRICINKRCLDIVIAFFKIY